ncbi:hypothetical protein HJFPF1_09023 [Paramyrothecium foliicola]|nr:hypothetical protein HJFPF1_09023 [Paramyrothecium foliicola]
MTPVMMADAAGASTPSPPPRVHTPPAPRFGYHDSWEPFTPRKSARLSSQRTANRTPSPGASPQRQTSASPRTKKINEQRTVSLVSPMPSPQKKRQPRPDSVHRFSGALSAATALNPPEPSNKPTKTTVSRTAGMLPTPSKTPQKPPSEKTVANIQSFARNLFPQESSVASPRKKRAKQYSGMTLESFRAEEEEDLIDIFTDSRDRIPEKDESEANPFLSKTLDSTKRRSKRRHVAIPGEGSQLVEEASRRDDGMVYVFRGKRVFRKFSADDDGSHIRNAVKPRVLFGDKKGKTLEIEEEDEEATTDIEEHELEDTEELPQTPSAREQERAKTPEAPKYAPVSPPDTKRITRSTNKLLDEGTPLKGSGRRSPFDSWQRTKEHKTSSASKRSGDDLAPAQTKRTRI